MTSRLCILASWTAEGGLPPHVGVHLQQLRPLCTRLVLVSNAPLGPDMSQAQTLCDQVIERPNRGFDFAAWRDTLEAFDMAAFDEVLLTNSSVIGPLRPLGPIFDRMAANDCDFWGLTWNRERTLHLQSFFQVFRSRLITSPEWAAFWDDVSDAPDKMATVHAHEIPMTRHFTKAGFRADSLIPPGRLPGTPCLIWRHHPQGPLRPPRLTGSSNQSMTVPAQLIAAGMPYLKASHLIGNTAPLLARIRALPDVKYPWELLKL